MGYPEQCRGSSQLGQRELEKEGRLKDARSLEGILLRVMNTEIMENKIIIEGSLFKSL
jgi:hypothetical protein